MNKAYLFLIILAQITLYAAPKKNAKLADIPISTSSKRNAKTRKITLTLPPKTEYLAEMPPEQLNRSFNEEEWEYAQILLEFHTRLFKEYTIRKRA